MSLASNFKQTTYLGYLAILRIIAGYFFLQVGSGKLSPGFLGGEGLARQLSEAAVNNPISLHRDFILDVVVPNAELFSYLICFGEIAIGISLITGYLVRVSSSFGAFHNLNILLAIAIPGGSSGQFGLNLTYIFLH